MIKNKYINKIKNKHFIIKYIKLKSRKFKDFFRSARKIFTNRRYGSILRSYLQGNKTRWTQAGQSGVRVRVRNREQSADQNQEKRSIAS